MLLIFFGRLIVGKLSKSQIQKAYAVLSELLTLIKQEKQEIELIDACNRFYTLVPHSFGVDEVPVIRDEETVKASSSSDMIVSFNKSSQSYYSNGDYVYI